MEILSLKACQQIAGGANAITIADVSIPTTGLSQKCIPVLEDVLTQMTSGDLSKQAADMRIAEANCQKDYAKLIHNFQKVYFKEAAV